MSLKCISKSISVHAQRKKERIGFKRGGGTQRTTLRTEKAADMIIIFQLFENSFKNQLEDI